MCAHRSLLRGSGQISTTSTGQALDWCTGIAAERRCPEDKSKTVAQAFREEQPLLLSLPANPFYTRERVEARVGKTPYVRFDLNDYSVSPHVVGKTVTVMADLNTVTVSYQGSVVAEHRRCFDKGRQLEDGDHIAALADQKRAGRKHRGFDELHHAAPSAKALLQATALRGASLGFVTKNLLHLLQLYGAAELEIAIQETLSCGSSHHSTVRQVLEQRRKNKGLAPPIHLSLPSHISAASTNIKPHSLATYDNLTDKSKGD
jgi:hypothetical protein